VDIAGKFIEGSLSFSQPNQPVTKVSVTVSAEWTNSVLAYFDVGSQLATDGFFGTLNVKDWSSFPKIGESVGNWTVVKSEIFRINPPNGLDPKSAEFSVSADSNPSLGLVTPGSRRSIKFNRNFYAVELVVAGVASMRRKETVTFDVN